MNFSTRLHTCQSQVFRMGHVINVLQMSGSELDEHLLQTARENPFLRVRQRRRASVGLGNAQTLLDIGPADAPTSLYDHVLRELAGLIARGGPMERLVLALVEELEPTGWLGRPVAEIAADLRLPEKLVEDGLKLVQKRVSPTGLFAQNLADCLRLQLEEQQLLSAEMGAILSRLDLLERKGLGALADAAGLDRERVEQYIEQLRRLDPKPGARFSTDPTLLREPDVRVKPLGEGWAVILKSNFETQVACVPEPAGCVSSEIRQALREARALKQALDLRQSALKKIMRYVVDVQGNFFRDGPEALRPLTQAAIAEKTGFHLSTVSRVLNGLLVEGPHGVFEARKLCPQTASRTTGDGPSKPKVLSRLRAALVAECSKRPLSDQNLADLLGAEGLVVSRRVVAKYRHELGFAPVAQRRLRA